MASIHLVPNPAVLVVQAGFFLTTLLTIKKLILEPYLKVRAKREQATGGNQDAAREILAENEKKQSSLQSQLQDAAQSAKEQAERVTSAALEEKTKIISAAEKEASSVLDAMRSRIEAELSEEKAKIPAVVSQLTESIYNKAIQ